MRKLLPILVLMAAAQSVHAVDNQAFFAIFAETKVTKMAGMPAMPEMPDMPAGMKMPDMPGMSMFSGAPQRTLTVRLWSPNLAPANATASVVPPEGLKQGKKLDLEIFRPKPEKTTGDTGGKDQMADPSSNPNFTIKIYWGSSETVKPGQPKIIKWTGLTADQKAEMKKRGEQAKAAESYFYKPNWTTAYWPTKKQPGKIDKDASLVGSYALTTNYTGNVVIDAPANVDFLGAIDMASPKLDKKIPMDKFIPFQWKQIPNALGFYASIIGMEGKDTLIMWSSSEVFQEGLMGDMGFLQMAEVREFVKQTVFMKGEQTKVNVPAGIFQNADMAMFNMVGYGPGAALETAQPLPRIQTKTSLNIMLGGKKMADMGDMGDEEESE